jgi:quercetin dioxygenase-like cupin family protein
MNPLTHSKKIRILPLLIAPALAAFTPAPVFATPQAGVTSVPIADGAFAELDILAKTDIDPSLAINLWKARIYTKGASHLYIVQNTVAPGGTFGWHRHPGPSLVIVKAGAATEYEGNDPTCTPHVYPAGSTFVDAGETSGHLVRNEGSGDLVVIVVRLVPEGTISQRIDLLNPGYCPGLN